MTNTSILAHILANQNILVMQRQSNGKFQRICETPEWVNQFYPNLAAQGELSPGQIFPVVENFLFDAESFWLENQPGALESGIWTEIKSGNKLHLEALAVCQQQNKILLINTGFEGEQRAVQKARETHLSTYKAFKEGVNEFNSQVSQLKKAIFNLTLFQDNLNNLLESLNSRDLNRNQFLEKINRYPDFHRAILAQLIESLKISGIEDTFRAKIKSLVPFALVQEAPDVFSCAKELVDIHRKSSSYLVKKVNLELDTNINPTGNWNVLAEEKELSKVLDYLIENVVSFSQSGSTVTVGIHDEGDFIVTTIGQGTGIEPEIAPTLFQQLSQSQGNRGTIPQKLDFCCIIIERWRGTIGVYDRPEGGSVFRICLLKAVDR